MFWLRIIGSCNTWPMMSPASSRQPSPLSLFDCTWVKNNLWTNFPYERLDPDFQYGWQRSTRFARQHLAHFLQLSQVSRIDLLQLFHCRRILQSVAVYWDRSPWAWSWHRFVQDSSSYTLDGRWNLQHRRLVYEWSRDQTVSCCWWVEITFPESCRPPSSVPV